MQMSSLDPDRGLCDHSASTLEGDSIIYFVSGLMESQTLFSFFFTPVW